MSITLDEAAAPARTTPLTVWHTMQSAGMLRCPACRAPLHMDETRFTCTACPATYPISGTVPLLLRPEDVVSVPDRVMDAFNIPHALSHEVKDALATLTQYRAGTHPEFANFFARFDPTEGHPRPIPLTLEQARAAVEQVSCLTSSFPPALQTQAPEYRSIRIRNNSNHVLFADERGGLSVACKLFDASGAPVPSPATPAPLPCPVRPGGEVTVPVLVQLPPTASGRITVRFYFQFADLRPVAQPAPPPTPPAGRLKRLYRRLTTPPAPPPAPAGPTWLDAHPLAEMVVEAVPTQPGFPATRRGDPQSFDVHGDVTQADAFLAAIIRRLRDQDPTPVRILEIGSGVYPVALRACDDTSLVVASDISLVMQRLAAIMHANNPATRAGRAGFTSFDAMFPPFAPGSFDVICICAALHHMPTPVEFLRTLAPLLSPRGRFVALREPCVVDPHAPAYISELANGFNEQMFELPEWSAMVANAGLAIDEAVIDYGCSLKFSARLS